MTPSGLRYLLDQNFPTRLVHAMSPFMPAAIELHPVPEVDPRLSDATDRALILWASRNGFDGLISTNHRMVNQPSEVAAMVQTRLTMVLTKSMGHSPLRASGALFLELPTLHNRVRPGKANVFMLNFQARRPEEAWDYLASIARGQGVPTQALWSQMRPTRQE